MRTKHFKEYRHSDGRLGMRKMKFRWWLFYCLKDWCKDNWLRLENWLTGGVFE